MGNLSNKYIEGVVNFFFLTRERNKNVDFVSYETIQIHITKCQTKPKLLTKV